MRNKLALFRFIKTYRVFGFGIIPFKSSNFNEEIESLIDRDSFYLVSFETLVAEDFLESNHQFCEIFDRVWLVLIVFIIIDQQESYESFKEENLT